jgi:LacI family transcriptional regulator
MAPSKHTDRAPAKPPKKVTLKMVAAAVNLSPATVSVVLNRSPVAKSIPKETQERIFQAAEELQYRPNYMARSLRRRRSFSVGVLVPEISEGYAAGVMSGVEGHLRDEGYFYLVASHRSRADLLEEYTALLRDRLVEGFILINTPLDRALGVPAVSVSGHQTIDGVTNVVIDHQKAVALALDHLVSLGHRRIAFFKGHPGSADTEDRWQAILEGAAERGIAVRPELTVQLSGEPSGEVFSQDEAYQEGYRFGEKLLAQSRDFTALFAFNDVSAIGAMRAFFDAGLRVPDDVSIVGFDDIQSAAFLNPSLTTVRQPLREMGRLAGQCLLRHLGQQETLPPVVTVDPELVVRKSTGPAPVRAAAAL